MKLTKIFLYLSVVLSVFGCASVGRDYVRPEAKLPAGWHTALNNPVKAEADNPQIIKEWWKVFNDDTLNRLVGMTVDGNLDLKKAYASLAASRAKLGMTEAEGKPSLSASASAKGTYYGDTSVDQTQDSYSAGFDASWEIDLFGGVRKGIEAASADAEASKEALHDVLVSLTAETAKNYISLRAAQSNLSYYEKDIAIKTELYEIAKKKYRAGTGDETDVRTAQYTLEYAKTNLHDQRLSIAQYMNRLAVLTGQTPGSLDSMLGQSGVVPVVPVSAAAGIPADMLRRRPDIRQAERELAAQTARVGVAEADRYPKLTLSGTLGLSSSDFGSLFKQESASASIGPSLTWKLFDFGAIKNNIKVQDETRKQYLAAYESAVLNALEETENALKGYSEQYSKALQLAKAAESAEAAYLLARQKYQAGLAEYTDVKSAEQSYISYNNQLQTSKGSAGTNLVSLYKALGGGWESIETGEKSE
ncbi:efflux transporter outer membrane subunit [Seleniivibrio woodruffii]|uniref:NodT family efflux transporter outer membrane factor (OMF) lipoprotein n=2 Tax=Seleniivibrio woodruffii TaxID=1078050 RepID=A0A4R1K620_9BACT|nr:efflux transporter outer membrane subunit [Seleniivibrio woodruffii]TCK59417.1 NodT family efflux transporter outer membrane factor (OMF) lipoprotein [Seleniivibrio woodruffii]TVZ35542.1 NodT family efflux transporter outer membrane factor (OMF) lipoprotein [Seleniivibrio woodruffii]